MKKTVLLVDVQNIYYTTRDAYGQHFDYNRFWERATANRQVVKAIAYAVDRGDAKQRQFQAILRAIGFEVKLKPFIKRADGSAKGDWDVGITLDAMEYAKHADLLVLVSGDGDFENVTIERLRHLDRACNRCEAGTVRQLLETAETSIGVKHSNQLRTIDFASLHRTGAVESGRTIGCA
mgnify:CR=1 FL=1